ncbi:PepSY domain-containing protein [Aquibacillus sediminis]|uniref:PepSY domain-containing protein n=1 Tax=Aquibacillus sediminis TaxID=2574734 RepID=UPI001109755F|nr:PepSY domain-containing protein [Aquibacillus sediminis]
MDWKKVLISAGLGALAGYVIAEQVNNRPISPESALRSVKETFRKEGPISGSWIYMKPEELNKNGLNYTVYHGGITRTIDGQNHQYEFFVDADTGSVIEVAEREAS